MPFVKGSGMPRASRSGIHFKSPAKQLTQQVKQVVNSQIVANSEKKELAGSTSGTVSTSGFLDIINLASTGNTAFTRVGNEIKMVGKMSLGYQLTGADASNVIRIILFYSKSPVAIGNLPTVFDGVSRAVNKIKVLYDKIHQVQYNLVDAGNIQQGSTKYTLVVRKNINLGKFGLTSQYGAGTSTPTEGFLYLYGVSDSALVSHPGYTYATRLRFVDN